MYKPISIRQFKGLETVPKREELQLIDGLDFILEQGILKSRREILPVYDTNITQTDGIFIGRYYNQSENYQSDFIALSVPQGDGTSKIKLIKDFTSTPTTLELSTMYTQRKFFIFNENKLYITDTSTPDSSDTDMNILYCFGDDNKTETYWTNVDAPKISGGTLYHDTLIFYNEISYPSWVFFTLPGVFQWTGDKYEIYLEPGTTGSNAGVLACFDGDENYGITGIISNEGGVFVFKKNAIFYIPQNLLEVFPLVLGLGNISPTTLDVSQGRIFFLHYTGVYVIESGNPNPIRISEPIQESIRYWDLSDPNLTLKCFLHYVLIRVKENNNYITYVFDVSSKSWYKWDIDIIYWQGRNDVIVYRDDTIKVGVLSSERTTGYLKFLYAPAYNYWKEILEIDSFTDGDWYIRGQKFKNKVPTNSCISKEYELELKNFTYLSEFTVWTRTLFDTQTGRSDNDAS